MAACPTTNKPADRLRGRETSPSGLWPPGVAQPSTVATQEPAHAACRQAQPQPVNRSTTPAGHRHRCVTEPEEGEAHAEANGHRQHRLTPPHPPKGTTRPSPMPSPFEWAALPNCIEHTPPRASGRFEDLHLGAIYGKWAVKRGHPHIRTTSVNCTRGHRVQFTGNGL